MVLVGVFAISILVFIAIMQRFKKFLKVRKKVKKLRDVARVMFILVSMGQIFVTLPGTIKVGWPSNVRGFLQWFQGFVEFDVISITGTTCDKRVDFRAQFLFMAIIPLLIVFWAIIGYCLKGRERNARLQVDKGPVGRRDSFLFA